MCCYIQLFVRLLMTQQYAGRDKSVIWSMSVPLPGGVLSSRDIVFYLTRMDCLPRVDPKRFRAPPTALLSDNTTRASDNDSNQILENSDEHEARASVQGDNCDRTGPHAVLYTNTSGHFESFVGGSEDDASVR